MGWVEWFCQRSGNEGICHIPGSFITDHFNLYGLRQVVDHYDEAYRVLTGDLIDMRKIKQIEEDVIELYSLLHQRYVISEGGLDAMKQKYSIQAYGLCPRYLCHGCPLLPIGLSNEPRTYSVKYYCPCCKEIYLPADEIAESIDGCFFGNSFPMEFLIHFPEFVPTSPREVYQPRLFGFALSKESPAYRSDKTCDVTNSLMDNRRDEDEDDI